MKRFVFKLDPVLRARKRAEERVQRELARLQRQRTQIEERLRRQQQLIDEGRAGLRQRLRGTLDMQDLRLHAGAVVHQMRVGQKMLPELAAIHQQLEAVRQRLAEAARQRRAFELLRERRLEQWKREQQRAETAELDEIAQRQAASGLEERKDEAGGGEQPGKRDQDRNGPLE